MEKVAFEMCLKARGFEHGDEKPVKREAPRLKEAFAQSCEDRKAVGMF